MFLVELLFVVESVAGAGEVETKVVVGTAVVGVGVELSSLTKKLTT